MSLEKLFKFVHYANGLFLGNRIVIWWGEWDMIFLSTILGVFIFLLACLVEFKIWQKENRK